MTEGVKAYIRSLWKPRLSKNATTLLQKHFESHNQ